MPVKPATGVCGFTTWRGGLVRAFLATPYLRAAILDSVVSAPPGTTAASFSNWSIITVLSRVKGVRGGGAGHRSVLKA